MQTLVTEIHPENVTTVGETDPVSDDEDGVATVPSLLLEGDFQGLRVKGLQVSSYVLWFMPSEFETLAEFFGDAQ